MLVIIQFKIVICQGFLFNTPLVSISHFPLAFSIIHPVPAITPMLMFFRCISFDLRMSNLMAVYQNLVCGCVTNIFIPRYSYCHHHTCLFSFWMTKFTLCLFHLFHFSIYSQFTFPFIYIYIYIHLAPLHPWWSFKKIE